MSVEPDNNIVKSDTSTNRVLNEPVHPTQFVRPDKEYMTVISPESNLHRILRTVFGIGKKEYTIYRQDFNTGLFTECFTGKYKNIEAVSRAAKIQPRWKRIER